MTTSPESPLQDSRTQEISLARRCFNNLDRVLLQISSYPPGHPAIQNAIENTYNTFQEFFQLTDRLSVAVQPHDFTLYGTEEHVWTTEEPKDYCFVLSRDGIFLIHFLSGIDQNIIKRFAETLNYLLDNRNDPQVNAVTTFFEANFGYISYDALDESLAALAGIDLDMRNRDTHEEKELIEDLFNKAFKDEEGQDSGEVMDGNFEIKIQNPAARMKKIEVGSREFLTLDQDAQDALLDLRRGFLEHRELEHREGEILSAILGAKPKETLEGTAIEQIGHVMTELLQTNQPWEALTFLKIIHAWRDRFNPSVTMNLKDVVASCFDRRRILELVRQVANEEAKERRMILQMFNALHLKEASAALASVVGWTNLSDDGRKDIVRYLRERARHGFDFLEETIHEIPAEFAAPIMELLEEGMPRSRSVLIKLLTLETEPPLKAEALRIMRGTWGDDVPLVRDLVVPLITAGNSELRIQACHTVCETVPTQAIRLFEKIFTQELRKRPEEEVRELAQLYVKTGGPAAVSKLKELIQRRGLTTSEQERELAITVARSLIRTPNPAVIAMLDEVSKDWLVTARIRNTCKEIADILRVGN